MFGFGKKTIRVEFIEQGQDDAFAVTDMPLEQLPETFVIDTTMHFGEDNWTVMEAVPAEKAQFKKSGLVQLTLLKQEVESMDPNNFLFTLATMSNDFPAMKERTSLEDIIVFGEDDWRQVEFVGESYKAEISAELEAIKNVYDSHIEGRGYKTMHLREKITQPLKNKALSLEVLKEHFNVQQEYNGVTFNTGSGLIERGFALQTVDGWCFWGKCDSEGSIEFLNLTPTEEGDSQQFSCSVEQFLSKHELYFIDWQFQYWAGKEQEGLDAYMVDDL